MPFFKEIKDGEFYLDYDNKKEIQANIALVLLFWLLKHIS
ncbi:hypothetical protein HMPREF0496_2788 [Lentilactobacillus hilgardii ATCC 27305]|jgi:hypothetical protein|nr:hypothetical protein HMPREF0496_2788 [Lentilactobacillus hilgardii ATCC 27305]